MLRSHQGVKTDPLSICSRLIPVELESGQGTFSKSPLGLRRRATPALSLLGSKPIAWSGVGVEAFGFNGFASASVSNWRRGALQGSDV